MVCPCRPERSPKLSADEIDGRAPDDESFEEPYRDQLLDQLIGEEMGPGIADLMARLRRMQEASYRRAHPDEGLRERKRRLTRQTISDVATTLFAARGFENVKVSEVARRVGVSEKTVYNYFPTKESMVLDEADEAIERLAEALRERRPEESLTATVIRAIEADSHRFTEIPDEMQRLLPLFVTMIETTPALRAAWLEMHDRLVKVAREELALQAGVDPRDPEVEIAARALAGLAEVALRSRMRRILDGLRGAALQAAVSSDLERAARVLDTGLWSFELLTKGTRAAARAKELAQAAEQARDQVVSALRQAREAWEQLRREKAARAEQYRARGSGPPAGPDR